MVDGVIDPTAILKAVFNGGTDALFVKDTEGRYLLVNDVAAGFVGKPAHVFVGRHSRHLFPPKAVAGMDQGDNAVLSG